MVRLDEHVALDVDDQAQALQGWEQSYEQLGCGRFHGWTQQLLMADGVLLREATNRPLRQEIAPPGDHLVFAVPIVVEPGSMFAGRPLHPHTLVPLFPGQQYDVVATGALEVVGVSVHDSLLASLDPQVAEWLGTLRGRSLGLGEAVAAAARQLLLGACDEAARLSKLPQPTLRGRHLLESTLADLLSLAVEQDQIAGPSSIPRRAQARLQVMRRAIDYMRANLHNEIGVPEVCAAAFASRRTLQYCFEEFLHTTPQAYLRALRLNEARRTLKARADVAITEIAGALGFSSASHFTQHYKVMFGELPSQTLRGGV